MNFYLIQISTIILLLFFFSNLYGSCCRTSSLTYGYIRSDIVIEGVICRKDKMEGNNVVALLIEVEKNYKSNKQEVITYFMETQYRFLGTKGFNVGDKIILLHSSINNSLQEVQSILYNCHYNLVLLKPENEYQTNSLYKAAQRYYQHAKSTLEWLSSFPIKKFNAPTCWPIFENPIPLVTNLYFPDILEEPSKVVLLIIHVEAGSVSGYEFSADITFHDKVIIEEFLEGLSCRCLQEKTITEIPISLAFFESHNRIVRI